MPKFDYDLIVIGAGSGGVRASRFASQRHGKRVAVIENHRVGGTCVIRGCVPKKLLVYGAHFAEHIEDARGYGWSIDGVGFDWSKLIDAKETELSRLEGIYHRILRDAGVEEINGTGRVGDAHTVEVEGRGLSAEHIVVATGGWPRSPASNTSSRRTRRWSLNTCQSASPSSAAATSPSSSPASSMRSARTSI